MYNSNLFLLPNEQAALATLGTTSTAESYQTYAAGVKMNWKLGRQFSDRPCRGKPGQFRYLQPTRLQRA
jgi:hypothetical protein